MKVCHIEHPLFGLHFQQSKVWYVAWLYIGEQFACALGGNVKIRTFPPFWYARHEHRLTVASPEVTGGLSPCEGTMPLTVRAPYKVKTCFCCRITWGYHGRNVALRLFGRHLQGESDSLTGSKWRLGREKTNISRVSSERVFYQQRPLLISAASVSEVGSVRCVPFLYGDYSVITCNNQQIKIVEGCG